MSNEKVTLPREVAEEIRKARIHFRRDAGIVMNLRSHYRLMKLSRIFDNGTHKEDGGGLEVDLLMRALVNGYEVEKSPEEKVREFYKKAMRDAVDTEHSGSLEFSGSSRVAVGQANGISRTLDLLGIKIEGVNA